MFCKGVSAQDGRLAYYCKDGDTISNIAARYNLDGQLLAAVNNLEAEASLRNGRRLWIPLEPTTNITVAKGDTLWGLAKKHNTTVDQLIALNGLSSPDKLKIGQVLKLPIDGVEVPESSVAVAASKTVQSVASRGSSEFSWPLKGIITSAYGKRKSGNHHGLDIAAEKGTLISAAAPGEVIFAGWRSNIYGYCVIIEHSNNIKTVYAHASKVLVEKGQQVAAGDSLAKVGNTGNTTGHHLHFEIHIDGKTVDPQKYLR